MLAADARSGAKPITTSGAKRVAESILGIGLQLLDKVGYAEYIMARAT